MYVCMYVCMYYMIKCQTWTWILWVIMWCHIKLFSAHGPITCGDSEWRADPSSLGVTGATDRRRGSLGSNFKRWLLSSILATKIARFPARFVFVQGERQVYHVIIWYCCRNTSCVLPLYCEEYLIWFWLKITVLFVSIESRKQTKTTICLGQSSSWK